MKSVSSQDREESEFSLPLWGGILGSEEKNWRRRRSAVCSSVG